MSKRTRIYFRVAKGSLVPADEFARDQLRSRGYRINELVAAEIIKQRNPRFNRLVHGLGKLVVENVDGFEGIDPHKAIKRLQIEGRVACEEIGVLVHGYGIVIQLIPRSISYESMDEGEYQEAARGISRTIAERYWPQCTPDEIERMAELMIQEAA